MTAEIFEEWVRQLDQKFSTANRKIALIIDICTARPHVVNSIELIFLPLNTTSHTQPWIKVSHLESQVSPIGRSKTDRSIRREKSCTNHIDFIHYDNSIKDVECCF